MQQLRMMGFATEPLVWTSDDDYRETVVIIRSCWDYHHQPKRFMEWTEAVGHKGGRVLNPPATVRWNHDKRYLRELQAKGVRIVPTVWVQPETDVTLEQIVHETGWTEIVVKPAISATAWNTFRSKGDFIHRLESSFQDLIRTGCVLVQEFVREVLSRGEWSFVFFDGVYSHAVLKRPARSDYRVQHQFGGTVDLQARPDPSLINTATHALHQCPDRAPLYARIDGIQTIEGLIVMEIEQIEPALFLDDGTAARFARAIAARCDFQ
jgi:glutathione synthase/RimK-type ligase-like ATP-grasp enzyme